MTEPTPVTEDGEVIGLAPEPPSNEPVVDLVPEETGPPPPEFVPLPPPPPPSGDE